MRLFDGRIAVPPHAGRHVVGATKHLHGFGVVLRVVGRLVRRIGHATGAERKVPDALRVIAHGGLHGRNQVREACTAEISPRLVAKMEVGDPLLDVRLLHLLRGAVVPSHPQLGELCRIGGCTGLLGGAGVTVGMNPFNLSNT